MRKLVAASVFLALSAPALAEPVEFDLMHTRPECNVPGKKSTYCTLNDSKAAAQLSGMEKRVNDMLKEAQDPATAKIVIAYFSFSNSAVAKGLCERGKAGISIEGFFDNDYSGTGMKPAELRDNCQGPSGNNVKMHFLGKKDFNNGVWRLHHNKFLMVDSGVATDKVRVNFSSGNLSSSGLSIHFDHWVVTKADRNSQLVKAQYCVVDSLRKAVNPTGAAHDNEVDDPAVYRSSLEACFAQKHLAISSTNPMWVEQAIASEKIAPLFSPDPNNGIYRVLINQLDSVAAGGSIRGAMQHFLHPGIATALQNAVSRGVKVQLLMDDDILLGDSEVPGVLEFYNSYLDPAISGIDIRFMQTSAQDKQMMHNKYIIMKGVQGTKNRVFSGAGHFTSSGMKNNYENFYLTQDDGLVAKYDELFNYMVVNSLKASEVSQ